MADGPGRAGEFVDSYEDVSTFALDDEREHTPARLRPSAPSCGRRRRAIPSA